MKLAVHGTGNRDGDQPASPRVRHDGVGPDPARWTRPPGQSDGMDLGLRDRVYLVTGGSRGLGFAAAQALIADGARVVLSAPHETTAAAAAARLAQKAAAADSATWVAADNADPATPGRLTRRRQGPFWPPGRRADQRGRNANRDRRDHDGRSVAVRVRKRLPGCRPAGAGSRGRSRRRKPKAVP